MSMPPFFSSGYRSAIGSHRFTAEDIVAFARKYDPQPFHVDAEKARSSLLGGLCASGWHTAAAWMGCHRAYHDQMAAAMEEQGLGRIEFGPSPGFEQLRWIRPVYAGDTVDFINETVEARTSASRPGWHVHTCDIAGTNQKNEPVITFRAAALVRYSAP
jgi:acyl dehydratase